MLITIEIEYEININWQSWTREVARTPQYMNTEVQETELKIFKR